MEFFDKLGKKATEAYKMTADKTGKIAKEAKLKLKIGELKSQINEIYKEIGEKVYEKHIREEEIDIQKVLEEQCTKIDVLSDEIDSMLQKCLTLRDKKQCPNCNYQIDKDDKFCPKCGQKQNQELPKEVEVLETLEKTDVSPEKEQEKQDVKNRLQEKIQENDIAMENNEGESLEKTIEMESAIDTVDEVETEFTDPVENLQESNYDESNEEKKDE